MAETFPIKCDNCTEILDVAADIDVAVAYNCSMCGAAIVIAEAEDFDLPCPAEVTIEEQTQERLRFRIPRFLPGTQQHFMSRIALLMYGVFAGTIIAVLIVNYDPQRLGRMMLLTGFFVLLFYYTYRYQNQSCLLDLSRDQLIFRHFFGPFRFHLKYPALSRRNVCMKSTDFSLRPFGDPNRLACVKTRWWKIQLAESPNPDVARYVTHLIRRQLITIEREVQNG